MCTDIYQQFDPMAECACFSTIMYRSAHVGTQENGWHDVMKNAKMVSYIYPMILSQLPLSEIITGTVFQNERAVILMSQYFSH